MSRYELTWITESLAVGHAPMSFKDLEAIRAQGVDAIINLCAEYCDLWEIEQQSGFEVLFLPIPDGEAPDLKGLDNALAWLDEAIYLGKKVLVHCRHGIGRTGTFVTSYLLRRGFGLKTAEKALKSLRSTPTSYRQWRLLRKYDKRSPRLTIREPSFQSKNLVDLTPYFTEYECLVADLDAAVRTQSRDAVKTQSCGDDTDACCYDVVSVQLIEAAYMSCHLNKRLTQEERTAAIARAVSMQRLLSQESERDWNSGEQRYKCPLSVEGKCIAYPIRPIACRAYTIVGAASVQPNPGNPGCGPEATAAPWEIESIHAALHEISQHLFFALASKFLSHEGLLFPLVRVVSGRFVQDYFDFLCNA